ncbi:rhomboid family intramembrane serine protease [Candidatus Bathyarchaeota archaeon ex4484_135]|nr:MAG: rhomboid family intramembrane serine protease [Candidatus Bathyarchaeota archaeon ex4484_135]
MFPIRDINPVSRPPLMTRMLLLINMAFFAPVFWALVTGNDVLYAYLMTSLGLIPHRLLALQDLYTLVTSMFTHADLLHIIGNMLYLHIFGDNVEDVLGRARFVIFYFLCGFAAAFTHVLMCSLTGVGLDIPIVGASGAISGILGAYVVFFPRARILTFVSYQPYPIQVKAVYYIMVWFIYQAVWAMAVLTMGLQVSVAFWAHIGGFLAGLFFGFLFKEGVRLRAQERAWIGW